MHCEESRVVGGLENPRRQISSLFLLGVCQIKNLVSVLKSESHDSGKNMEPDVHVVKFVSLDYSTHQICT